VSLVLLCLLAAAPKGEVLREEAFNYRVVGTLPTGWQRRERTLHFTYRVDGVPHAHVDFARQRVGGQLDLVDAWAKRLEHYRFPAAGEDAEEQESSVEWAGLDALRFECEARLRGVRCRRRVTALYVRPVFFELIETVYGETTEEDPDCRAGLEVFRDGFRLLVRPLPADAATATGAGKVVDEALGYRLDKPDGFLRKQVDLVADPGCRVALERAGPGARQSVRVRLFEYGVYQRFEPERWLDIFDAAFAGRHDAVRREPASAGIVAGARTAGARRLHGLRDGDRIETLVVAARSVEGRVYVLQVRRRNDAPAPQGLRLVLD
jgi:hypothetical protein